MAGLNALLIHANLFAHHYIDDYRWYIAAATLGPYARASVVFRPLDPDRRMPLLLEFVVLAGPHDLHQVSNLKHIKARIHVPP